MAGSSTALCSVRTVTMCLPSARRAWAAPALEHELVDELHHVVSDERAGGLALLTQGLVGEGVAQHDALILVPADVADVVVALAVVGDIAVRTRIGAVEIVQRHGVAATGGGHEPREQPGLTGHVEPQM